MSGIISVAEGIGAAASVNTESQLTTGLAVIALVSMFLPLQQAWSDKLNADAEQIYIDNMGVPGNPGGTAKVAADTQARNVDSTNADLESGNIDNIIQGQKGIAQVLGDAMTAVFALEDPVNELLRATSSAIQQMAS